MFPLYSPRLDSVELVRRGSVRRAKLYYLRDRRGKSARIAERTTGHGIEANVKAKSKAAKAAKAEKAEKQHRKQNKAPKKPLPSKNARLRHYNTGQTKSASESRFFYVFYKVFYPNNDGL